ncbi:MAG: three-Cys-motif partner protein TcmP [Gammaproteobacteria bacterium]|nr:three-Cys-motif partner protein TcmP [Gammaproteobacteria bacterium]
MEIDENYEGREHSQIKHELLKGYLEKLLFIKGVKGTKELTYVDCFAGPWGDESSGHQATSIAISIDMLQKVRESLAATHKVYDVKFRAIYVEKIRKRHRELERVLDSICPSYIEHHALRGDYADKLDEILALCGSSFTFFFVDPKQWTPIGIPKLAKLLARKNSEFLITFMYDFLNRFLKKKELREQICSLLGSMDDSEIDALCALDPTARELTLVRKYRQALKAVMPGSGDRRPRSYHATVLDKDKERTKYHMVYLTSHPKGVVEFSNLSEDVGIFQRKVHFETRQVRTGQKDMFGIDEVTIEKLESADTDEVKRYWVDRLETTARIYDENDLADMLEDTDWLVSDFERAFKELQSEGKVENMDARRKRPVHPINFEKGERLRRCV